MYSANIVGFATFEDLVVGPDIDMYHTQHMRNLIKRIGEKYKMIVLNPGGSEISSWYIYFAVNVFFYL